jgi:hypothetical protein
MSEQDLPAEQYAELIIRDASLEQAIKDQEAAWQRLRRACQQLHLEAYLLTGWYCSSCSQQRVIQGLPRRKRCRRCQTWMHCRGLVRPERYMAELWILLHAPACRLRCPGRAAVCGDEAAV